jgi:predicted RNase H-like HicB family nuclease
VGVKDTREPRAAYDLTGAPGGTIRIGLVLMKKEFNVVVERDRDGFYVASIPELPGCHTQAKSLDELMERIREAAELCLELQGQEIEGLEFVGVQRLTLA